MNDQQLDRLVRQDAERVRKDLTTLIGHSSARLSRYEGQVGKATTKVTKDLTSWVADSSAQLSKSLGRLSGDAMDSVDDATSSVKKDVNHAATSVKKDVNHVAMSVMKDVSHAATSVKKDVGHGMRLFNSKAKVVAKKLPNNYGKKIANYPWAAIAIGITLGIFTGLFIRTARQSQG